jgi:hypothetical protein
MSFLTKRDGINDPSQLLFVLPELLFRPLEVFDLTFKGVSPA